tara:strand:- start:1186 stop:1506 length:321 start_codon:yes stop_codon:yes gene_type:complete
MKQNDCLEFYEYYFEPSGKDGMVFLQYLHEDFDKGSSLKSIIEYGFSFTQLLFTILILIILVCFAFRLKDRFKILTVILLLFSTRFINALNTNYTLYNAQKQSIFG